MENQETKKQVSEGKCSFCNATFSKAAMTRHLKSCKQREGLPSVKTKKRKILHLLVEGRGMPEYWMHIEVPANATLQDMDSFLRDTWLECCGHLSAFTIEGISYAVEPQKEFGDKSMRASLGKILAPGMTFIHEYDFGTTTGLTLKVMSEREGEIREEPVDLLARNEPPRIACESCGKTATQVCSQCIYSGEKAWFCDECASEHECGEDMFLPVVNSPRVGMCGYTG